jgi:type IV pilus assembly protein PilB
VTAIDAGTIHFVDLAGIVLEADALRRIPRTLALRHDVLSLSSEGNQLTIAIPDVTDRETIDRVRLATGMHVHAVQAPLGAIRSRLIDAYPDRDAAPPGRPPADEAPAVREVDAIHERAAACGASDVHIEPSASGGRVRHRVDGILLETQPLGHELFTQVVSRIKLLAGMDIADRRQPQDGRYAIELQGQSFDARVSSMPTIVGEKIVIRLLDNHAHIPSLSRLGMEHAFLERFQRVVHAPHGFIVVCGPTGSGKTTTLYAAMAERNVDTQNLCSVEDPVEVRIPGIVQVQINARAGVTFASALRAFLRQDPNVIMVGEMRDRETASVAASASLSGQLVMTTLHSSDAPRALDRLIELGIERQTIAAGLSAVIAQRLVRTLCDRCKVPYAVGAAMAAEFGIPRSARAYRAAGCSDCDGRGYRGRSALFEAVFVDDAVRTLIADGGSSVALRTMVTTHGYEPMSAGGLRRALSGQTSLEELRRVLLVEHAA